MLAVRAYQRALTKRPLITQMCSAGILAGSGDVIAQLAVEKRKLKNYDLIRTGRFFVLGSCYVAPVLFRWFRILERIPGNPKVAPLVRLAVDQIAFAPCLLSGFLINLRILEGNSPKESFDHWKKEFKGYMLASWKVWPMVQLVNFYLVPLQYRILVVQTVALFWNTYIAYRTQKPPDEYYEPY
uniref:Mitochondrial inner membrane protein Mpv17 n=1 Tax=Plectus sambesii TaxID=2011161 RepID=A0A914VLX5_9BILA